MLFLMPVLKIVGQENSKRTQLKRDQNLLIKKSLVLVRVSNVYYNYRKPWIKETGRSYTILGLVLPGKKILVLANDVRNSVLLVVRKYSSERRFTANIIAMDMEVNLALLEVKSTGFFDDLKPLETGGDPLVGERPTAVKVNDLFRVYRENVDITGINTAADFGFTLLPVAVFRSRESFRGGGIIQCGSKLCGFIGYTDRNRRANAILPSTFNVFLERASHAKYIGFIAQGFTLTGMADPVLREFYGLPENLSGALVVRIYPGTSSWGVLKKEDVLISINGTSIDNRGYYTDPVFGRQKAHILLVKDMKNRVRRPGESVILEVFRSGKKIRLEMKLRSYRKGAEMIPWLVNGRPNYIVESGIVFLELSVPYLKRRYGTGWKSNHSELAYLFNTKRYYEKPGNERIVILAEVLPDPINRGYENLNDLPVKTLNGIPVRNLRRMYEIIQAFSKKKNGRKILTIGLPGGQKIYIDLKNRTRVNARIMRRYRIPKVDGNLISE